MLVILTLERAAGYVVATAYVNGDAAGEQVATLPSLITLTRVTFGDALESDGSVTEGALWNRKLSYSEIVGQAFDLTCVYGEQGITPDTEEHPLLNDDGTSSVDPEWIVPLTHTHGVLASEGNPSRHTRAMHERKRRQYGLRIRLGNGREALILKDTLRVTAMGAMWTRWRHPKDDPAPSGDPPWKSAPRYRVVNAADASIAVARTGAGSIADFTLVLEDI